MLRLYSVNCLQNTIPQLFKLTHGQIYRTALTCLLSVHFLQTVSIDFTSNELEIEHFDCNTNLLSSLKRRLYFIVLSQEAKYVGGLTEVHIDRKRCLLFLITECLCRVGENYIMLRDIFLGSSKLRYQTNNTGRRGLDEENKFGVELGNLSRRCRRRVTITKRRSG